MKRLSNNKLQIANYIVPFILLVILPIITNVKVGTDTCNYIFTAVGVLFSVAMSLIIAFNTKEITNKSLKKRLRLRMANVRNVLIAYFLIAVIGLLLLKHVPNTLDIALPQSDMKLDYNFPFGYVAFLVWCIIIYIVNFLKIHQNYEVIEDAK